MPVNKAAIGLLFILIMGISLPSYAQLMRRRHMKTYVPPPKLIIVQLPSARAMAVYYQKKHQAKKAIEVRAEAALAAKAMVKDFGHNYHFCPVYFVYDSNIAFIPKGRVEGILITADGSIAGEQAFKAADTNFLIVCYGYADQEGNMVETRQGLIVSGYDNRQRPEHFPFRVFPSSDPNNKQFSYVSKKYEIEYIATARELDRTLRKYYDDSWRDYQEDTK